MRTYIASVMLVALIWPIETGAWFRLPNPSWRGEVSSRFSRRSWEERFQVRRAKVVDTIRRAQPKAPVTEPAPKAVSAVGTEWDVSAPTFLLLGSVSPIIGAARVFSDKEPFNVSAIHIVLMDAVPSVQSFLVYDGQSEFLGNAYLDASIAGGFTYVLPIKTSTLILPKREVFQFYVKARLRSHNEGGGSGDSVQIRYLVVKGAGFWSNRSYSQSTSETFGSFETARSMIKHIKRVSPETGVLVSGPGQYLGAFQLEGVTGDPGANIRITDLTFQINQGGGVEVSNVTLKRLGSGTPLDCTSASATVTCSAIPESDGSVRSGPTMFQIYGDVLVPSGLARASLQLLLNESGNSSSAGSIGWTDGHATFQWVQFEQPVAPGTMLSY